MDTPKRPEKPDWVEGPLHEEWDLGKDMVIKRRIHGAPIPDPSDMTLNSTRKAAYRAWKAYFEEVDRAQDQEG